ncbi:acetyl-coenzyme A synthetase 2-like, mitochondrial isoform X2 [Oratosquilla oratoria]|uniref:acetyl-coenzyme A synthetase 2-like, mitochondrial isoform X2 n=1 Tax=Oratosquilla oratoria TaxID=337810 RepID=UPI003F76FB00
MSRGQRESFPSVIVKCDSTRPPQSAHALCVVYCPHRDILAYAGVQPEEFWGRLAKSRLQWQKEFTVVSESEVATGSFRWFPDGDLNVAVNCVDRHAALTPEKSALIWEKDEPGQEQHVTYRELLDMVCRLANVLLSEGVRKGDRVALYMPVCPMAVAAMLACARIGAIHSVVFAGFSKEALAARIRDASASVVITTDEGVRGGKVIPLKQTVDAAVKECRAVRRVLVAARTGAQVPMGPLDVSLEEAMASASSECPPATVGAEDFLFMLYTSGSTGKPKGIAHSSAGYLLYASVTHKHVFDYRPGDVFGCVADIGWITGHTYVVYGPLANGATTVLFESTPTYPDPGRYWETVERLRITQFYGAPTAIRLLIKHGDIWVHKYDRSSLRTLGSVGEPINHEAWHWYHTVVGNGNCTVVDTWWQTETGGIMLSPRPSAPDAPIAPAMPMRPMFGIRPILCDEKGRPVQGNDVSGALCIQSLWPGMARTVFGDHKRFMETYFNPYPGYYFSGDGGHRDADGFYHITGRMDDVINVTGHRLGTAEVEDAMTEHPSVAETAVVGFPHDVKGEGVYAFVTLKDNIEEEQAVVLDELKKITRTKIAAYAVPDVILVCPGLPKTRSGKIMRRLLRQIAANRADALGDVTTLADPSVVSLIVEKHRQQNQAK